MNTTELIFLTNQLSTDKSYLTAKERLAYLDYLNLANFELYGIISGGLNTICKKVRIFYDEAEGGFPLPADMFRLRHISVNKTSMLKGSIIREDNMPPKEYLVMGDYIYCNTNNFGLQFLSDIDPVDGITKKYIILFYAPNPKKLVEIVEDVDTETTIPVLPVPYHIFLIHGALYYFYFGNKIFMDKMSYIVSAWESDKDKLAQFKNNSL